MNMGESCHREMKVFEGGLGGQFSKCPPNLCTCMPAHQAIAWTCATEAMILRKILIREMAGAQAPKMSPHVIPCQFRGHHTCVPRILWCPPPILRHAAGRTVICARKG